MPNRNTTDACIDTVTFMGKDLMHDSNLQAILQDLSKTFACVKQSGLFNIGRKYATRGIGYYLLPSNLCHRNVCLNIINSETMRNAIRSAT